MNEYETRQFWDLKPTKITILYNGVCKEVQEAFKKHFKHKKRKNER
jgi:hypothetical protein